nr:MAG TPA: Mononegavirales mRNA-capping region V [Inoviridae sp.]
MKVSEIQLLKLVLPCSSKKYSLHFQHCFSILISI